MDSRIKIFACCPFFEDDGQVSILVLMDSRIKIYEVDKKSIYEI